MRVTRGRLAFASVIVIALAIGGIHWLHGSKRATAVWTGPPDIALSNDIAAARRPDTIEPILRGMLDRSSLRAQGTFTSPGGERYTVSRGSTFDRTKTCVEVAGGGFGSSACDAQPFAHGTVLFVESFSAGPGGKDVTDWELGGLAAPQVARVELVDSLGRVWPLPLSAENAFFFAMPKADVVRRVEARSLRVYGAGGQLFAGVDL